MSIYNTPERPLEPSDVWRDDIPLRYCQRCGEAIYHGDEPICDGCLDETEGRKGMLEYMGTFPALLLKFLTRHRDEEWLDDFFETFYDEFEYSFERWRRE